MRALHVLALLVATASVVACTSASGDEDEEAVTDETGQAVTESVPVGTALYATSNVSLRAEATTESRRIRIVAKGDSVKVVVAAPKEGFYRVTYGGDTGWVFGRYLKKSGAADTDEPAANSSGGSYAHTKNIKIVYQGSCDFLHRCDSYSRPLPAGQVNWGCLGRGAVCVDSEHWASGPSRAYCGKTVKFCKGSTCTTAVIKDVSVSQDFEASQGVFDALGIGYGGGSTCSNTFINGDPRVTVSY